MCLFASRIAAIGNTQQAGNTKEDSWIGWVGRRWKRRPWRLPDGPYSVVVCTRHSSTVQEVGFCTPRKCSVTPGAPVSPRLRLGKNARETRGITLHDSPGYPHTYHPPSPAPKVRPVRSPFTGSRFQGTCRTGLLSPRCTPTCGACTARTRPPHLEALGRGTLGTLPWSRQCLLSMFYGYYQRAT